MGGRKERKIILLILAYLVDVYTEVKPLKKPQFFPRLPRFPRFPRIETEENEEVEKIVEDHRHDFFGGSEEKKNFLLIHTLYSILNTRYVYLSVANEIKGEQTP